MKKLLPLFLLLLFGCQPKVATVNSPASTPVKNQDITVQLTFEVENIAEKRPKIVGQTNLPDGTKLGVWIKGKSVKYNGQSSFTVQNGKFESEEFSADSKPLPNGNYEVDVTMPIASRQTPSVRSVIGEKAENLKGDLVKNSDDIDGIGNVVQVKQDFVLK